MSEHYEHNVGDHEDPLPGPTWLIGFIGAVLLVVIFFGLTALYYRARDREDETKLYRMQPIDLETLNRAQVAQIEDPPRWVVTRQDGKIVDRRLVIPVEEAMRKVAETYR